MCLKLFNKVYLKKHINAIHEKKPHKCSICDQNFAENHQLKSHIIAVHEGKKSHKCSIRDKNFSRKDHLLRQVDSVHDEKNLSLYIYAQFVTGVLQDKINWKYMLIQFMKEKNAKLKRTVCKYISMQFLHAKAKGLFKNASYFNSWEKRSPKCSKCTLAQLLSWKGFFETFLENKESR